MYPKRSKYSATVYWGTTGSLHEPQCIVIYLEFKLQKTKQNKTKQTTQQTNKQTKNKQTNKQTNKQNKERLKIV